MSINWDSLKIANSPFYAEEYNNMRDHADEKTADYILRKKDSCYESIKGGTGINAGKIMFGGATNEGGVSGLDWTAVFNATVNALPHVNVQLPNAAATIVSAPHGVIFIKSGEYHTGAPMDVPLGSRIIIWGEGTTQQMIQNGIRGGTQIINEVSTSAFRALSVSGVTSTGTVLIMKNIEFVQQVNLASAITPCVDLDGMAQGILENVQAVKNYGSQGVLTGTGISCNNAIGGDDAGGDSIWIQVQVAGFTTGINVRIDHWEVYQLDITKCTTAIEWYVCLNNNIHGLHVFECDRILAVYGGFTTYGHAYIHGLYLEDSGGGVGGNEWYIDSTFHGYIRIFNTNVNVCTAGTLWRCNDPDRLWFEDVMVAGGAPVFPAVVTPATVDDTIYINDNMQLVEVWVEWDTIDYVKINGVTITTSNDLCGTFQLRPADYIQINVSAGTYSWHWRAVSAERGHQDDY